MSMLLLVVNTFTVLIKSGGIGVLNTSLKGSRNAADLFSMTTCSAWQLENEQEMQAPSC